MTSVSRCRRFAYVVHQRNDEPEVYIRSGKALFTRTMVLGKYIFGAGHTGLFMIQYKYSLNPRTLLLLLMVINQFQTWKLVRLTQPMGITPLGNTSRGDDVQCTCTDNCKERVRECCPSWPFRHGICG